MKLDKNTPAHEWWTDSGALQTRKIIYSWTLGTDCGSQEPGSSRAKTAKT